MPRRTVITTAAIATLVLAAGSAVAQSLDSCFCCNNCVLNYFTDMPKGQAADALFRQQDFQGCVDKASQLRTPTAYQKVLHAKCLEGIGELEQARTMYREIVAGDPQQIYSPAREATARLAALGTEPSARHAPASSWPSVARVPRRVGGGERDAAVIVGIGEPFVLPTIPGAVDNATDWYGYLTSSLGLAPARTTLLRNAEATREAMLEAARRAAKDAVGGRVWFIFVGHGAPALGGEDGLLLGADAQATEASLAARGVSQRELLTALRGGRASSVVAVFDACFSGTAPDGKTPLVPGSQATVPVRRAPADAGVVVLSSSERVAGALPSAQRPAYSYLLLGALFGWADANLDGKVTATEAHRYVGEVLKAAVRDRDQAPSLDASQPHVVLAPSAGAIGPDVAAIIAGPIARY
ncbi:MAG: hypothetical protein HYS27_18975 [Deltaproteobacteria bacterium]|nr:hypothetical protein [Deltaproteobacteria bacterium]